MAILNLVKTERGTYLLQGAGDPCRNANFSLFDLDGEGGDPFQFGTQRWFIVELPGVGAGIEYDADDNDDFWRAQAEIIAAAKRAGIEIPAYAEGE